MKVSLKSYWIEKKNLFFNILNWNPAHVLQMQPLKENQTIFQPKPFFPNPGGLEMYQIPLLFFCQSENNVKQWKTEPLQQLSVMGSGNISF